MTKIGLEIHCQLTNLQSKLFCPCKSNYRSMTPNSNICPVCVGLPGSLPRLNRNAVRKALMIAISLGCDIPDQIAFFRKNYFYPDLPKNFQITQLDIYGNMSIGNSGSIEVGKKSIRITRVQLEEDPGRLIYEGVSSNLTTLIDYNRAGTPLVEIVTEPDFADPRQVRDFLYILSDLLENLGVSDPRLEGAIRADANVSIDGGQKVEIKNIGSFHDLEKAIHYEITRQQSLHSRDIEIANETRHWDDKRRITIPSRTKEDVLDYRYFLEGDIPWVLMDSEIVDSLKFEMPESISSKKNRYIKYGIQPQVANILASDKFYSDLFDNANEDSFAIEIANIITTDLMGLADTREKRESLMVTAEHIRDIASAIQSGQLSRNSAKGALYEIVKTGKSLQDVISKLDLGNLSSESHLLPIIREVIAESPDIIEQAKLNPSAINFLVGQVMKKTKGKADPTLTNTILQKELER